MSVAEQIALTGRARTLLGSDPACDVVFADAAVAAQHATIALADGRFVLVALEGDDAPLPIYVNGRRVRRHGLRDGDVIRVGSEDLRYAAGALSRARPVTPPPEPPARPSVVVPAPASGERAVTIGRDPSSDVYLDHPSVSRRHALLVIDGAGQASIRDGDSVNGTYVGSARVDRQPLAAGDVVRIGPYSLAFDGASLALAAAEIGIRLDAVGLTKTVATSGGPLRILDDVSFTMLPDEFVAIVGGSGAGKSTLLKALNGFQPADGVVLADGTDLYANFDAFRPLIGYVPQGDIVHRGLPVRHALDYVARLRLPRDTTAAERAQRIDQVLASVGLSERADTMIDRLSGGQLKRVSTAVELLAAPRVLFLDEPTSGLDPGLDQVLMETFRSLTREGRTVVLVTHTTANLHLCDRVAFMAPGGRLAFFGTPAGALEFFGTDDYPSIYRRLNDDRAGHEAARFATSAEHVTNVDGRQLPAARVAARARAPRRPAARPVAPARQAATLTRRYLELIRRDVRNSTLLLLQAPLIALLIFVVARDSALLPGVPGGGGATPGEKQTVAFVLVVVAAWFGMINAAREVTKELPIYLRERLANLGVVPYLASKVIVLFGLVLVQTAALLLIVSLRTGMPNGEVLGGAPDLYVTLVLVGWSATALALLLSALVSNEDRALTFMPYVLIPQIVLAGVIFELSGVASVLAWPTISYWGTHAAGALAGMTDYTPLQLTGINLDYGEGSLVGDWIVLAAFCVALLIATGLAIRRRDTL